MSKGNTNPSIRFDLIGFPQWVLDREQLDIVLLVTNYPSDCLATCDGVSQSESMLQNPDQSQASCHPPYAALITHQQKALSGLTFARVQIKQKS